MELRAGQPDYVFEVSWEVCNKVGGIYTAISTKANSLVSSYGDGFIMIGPDVWRGSGDNPEFEEDFSLFNAWREKAIASGLKVRIGRWKINARPVVILIDFSPCYTHKDEIFTEFYKDFGLDSLTGQWDYIEPALFGHNAGQVIESFCDYYFTPADKIVAQFHEWLTGAGILYLKNQAPAIATTFTTHATVVGRALVGNGGHLENSLENIDADAKANEFNERAKHSLEKTSARFADVFTAVSELTARECKFILGKEPDFVTPNGFENPFDFSKELFTEKREIARKKLLSVAAATGAKFSADDAILIGTSGRYEFTNKGFDLFIEALGKLNSDKTFTKNIVAYCLVPAASTGPRSVILDRIKEYPDSDTEVFYTTHHLQNKEDDPIIKSIQANHLGNTENDRVKIIFVSVYLDGFDGIFNLNYYELLMGFDLTAFPSSYEPWGYTPLESMAFSVPTITTTLSGIGLWIKENVKDYEPGISIIEKTATNRDKVIQSLTDTFRQLTGYDEKQDTRKRKTALDIADKLHWKKLFPRYQEAYSYGLKQVEKRGAAIRARRKMKDGIKEAAASAPAHTFPKRKKALAPTAVPKKFSPLNKLANNLWWSWNADARNLFRDIDKELWEQCVHNPVDMLSELPSAKYKELEGNKEWMARYEAVTGKFDDYMSQTPEKGQPLIAYFCMEYAIDASLKIYSGGLGVLAGDYMKEVSDQNRNFIGVGLMYQYGYFKQNLSIQGEQIVKRDDNNLTLLPLSPVRDKNGRLVMAELHLPGRTVYIKAWKANVGRVPLYLLDTDVPENDEPDRFITDQLYSGDNEHRLLQEFVLGIGGVRLMNNMGITPDLYHMNEGHAAFTGIERLRKYITEKHIDFRQAIEIVRSSALFTTHTPVPAGHDRFSEELLRGYFSHFPAILNISWEDLMSLGKVNVNDPNETFSMSNLAISLSQEVNAVSKIHEDVTRKMFAPLWKGYEPEELFIGHVTNGVHVPTWLAPEWGTTAKGKTGETKMKLKGRLVEQVKLHLTQSMQNGQREPAAVLSAQTELSTDKLIIGFARRVTGYKRPELLFTDLTRLAAIVYNKEKPVIILFAGKAHPADFMGHDEIKRISEIAERAEFKGKIIFLDNYNLELAGLLVQGVDIWLNTPERGMEASGTSGMKAMVNGTLQFSVPDGWWAEAYAPGRGWTFPEKETYQDYSHQNAADANVIYDTLEKEIVPLFYNKNAKGFSDEWIKTMQTSAAFCIKNFSATRAINEYYEKYYTSLFERSKTLLPDKFKVAKEIAAWKKRVSAGWDSVKITKVQGTDFGQHSPVLGDKFEAVAQLDPGNLSPEDIGVEVIFYRKNKEGEPETSFVKEMKGKKTTGKEAEYTCSFKIDTPDVYRYAIRAFPKNKLLPHRQDFALLKWA